MKLESFYVKFGAIADDGLIPATVIFAFIPPGATAGTSVNVDVVLPEQLDAPLRELRQQALAKAVLHLQAALSAATQSTAEELHAAMLDHIEDSKTAFLSELDAPFQQNPT